MISFHCPICDTHYTVDDKLAGTQAKCKCGSAVAIPAAPATIAAESSPPSNCPSCRGSVQPDWVSCPICGENLSPQTNPQIGALPTVRSDNQTPAQNVVLAEIVETPAVGSATELKTLTAPISSAPVLPSVNVGNDSVVKANIDSSVQNTVNEQIGGDRVSGDKVDGIQVNADTVVQNFQESNVKGLVDGVKGILSPPTPGKVEADAILRDLDLMNDDPKQLASIFVKHITGITKVGSWVNPGTFILLSTYGLGGFATAHKEKREVKTRAQVCGAALLRIKMVCGNQPEWADFIANLEQQLAEAKKSANLP